MSTRNTVAISKQIKAWSNLNALLRYSGFNSISKKDYATNWTVKDLKLMSDNDLCDLNAWMHESLGAVKGKTRGQYKAVIERIAKVAVSRYGKRVRKRFGEHFITVLEE